MIEEVLKEIKLAEADAQKLMKDALQSGKQIYLDAEIEAEKLKKEAIAKTKQGLRDAVVCAQARAEKVRVSVLDKGKKEADKFLLDKQGDLESISDKILDLLLKKY